jgi:hypothetical protein
LFDERINVARNHWPKFPCAAKSFDGTAASFDFSEVRKRIREIFFRVSEHSTFFLATLNTPEEIDASFRILEMLEGWH